MPITRRSVPRDARIAERVARAAEEDGLPVSQWLAQAVEHALRRHEGLRGVREWEDEAGALTPAERAAGEILLRRLLNERGGTPAR
jgi:hypothetical protein